MNQKIIDFYEGKLKVGRNSLSFDDIIRLDDDGLEKCHDYIQWLFPLPEPSSFMKNAPLLDKETAKLIANEYSMRVMEAVRRIMKFWRVTLNLHSPTHKPHMKLGQYWMKPKDHNHYRITRVIRFLFLLSKSSRGEQEKLFYFNPAQSLLYAVLAANDEQKFATAETVDFWEEALEKGW
jgi:hypothetical protein